MKRLQLNLKLSALKRGNIHGEEYRVDINELVLIRKELIANYFNNNWEVIDELALSQLKKLKKFGDLYKETLGIAEGSNCRIEDIIILNNYTDMRDFSYSDQGCTSFAIKNDMFQYCGQTWDMHASARPYTLLLELLSEEGSTWILSLTGCLGMSGINFHNLAVHINNMHSRETDYGLIWPALVRLLLEKNSVKEAKSFLINHLPCSGHNYLLCDSDSFCHIETTGKRYSQLLPQNKHFAYHTNHYLSHLKETEIFPQGVTSTTFDRYKTIQNFLENSPDLDYSDFCEQLLKKGSNILLDSPDGFHSACTCGGLILNQKDRNGYVFEQNLNDPQKVKIQW